MANEYLPVLGTSANGLLCAKVVGGNALSGGAAVSVAMVDPAAAVDRSAATDRYGGEAAAAPMADSGGGE